MEREKEIGSGKLGLKEGTGIRKGIWEHELQARLNTALEIELGRGIGKGNFERPRYFILESFSVIGSISSKPAHPAFVIFVSGDTNAATLESLHDRLSLSWASKFSSLTLESKISSMA